MSVQAQSSSESASAGLPVNYLRVLHGTKEERWERYLAWDKLNKIVAPLEELQRIIETSGWSWATHMKLLKSFFRAWFDIEDPQGKAWLQNSRNLLEPQWSREQTLRIVLSVGILAEYTVQWWHKHPKAPWEIPLLIISDQIHILLSEIRQLEHFYEGLQEEASQESSI